MIQILNTIVSNLESQKQATKGDDSTTLKPIVVLPSPTQDWCDENAFEDKKICPNDTPSIFPKKRPMHKCEQLFLKALQDRHGFELRTINCFDRCEKLCQLLLLSALEVLDGEYTWTEYVK